MSRVFFLGLAARSAALCLVAGALAAASAPSALAQGTAVPVPQRLDPLSVTATRGLQPTTDLLADVTVIGRDEIARSGAQSLPELLQRQPGTEIVQNGGPASVSGVFLRGANTTQTLVLVDGIRLTSSTTGSTALEAIPLDQIERIEVLRGPASSLYGADAIGGVIQVFTRRGTEDFSANVAAGYGTYSTRTVTGGVSGSVGPLRLSVQGGATKSAGFNAIVNPSNFSFNDDPDGYDNANVSAYATLPWADGQQLTAQYFRNRLNAQFDGGPGSDDRTITTVETWQVASRNQLAPFWVSLLVAGEGTDDSVSETGFGDFPFKTTQRQYLWQNELTLPLGILTAGLERREERDHDQREFRGDLARHQFCVRDLPVAVRRQFAASERPARRFEPVRRKDDRRSRLRLPVRAVVPDDRGRQHRLQGADVQRSLLPRLFEPVARAGDLAQRRDRRVPLRNGDGWNMGGARDRLPEPGERADRLHATPISIAFRRTCSARRSKA